jgi:hypothetical protein
VRHTRLVICAIALIVLAAACGPRVAPAPAPGPSLPVYSAINKAFGPYGSTVVSQAFRVAKCESGWVPTAGAGSYYQGLFQLGRHIAAINNYGGNYLDAWQNAQAARDLYVSRGRSWSAWSCQP